VTGGQLQAASKGKSGFAGCRKWTCHHQTCGSGLARESGVSGPDMST